MVSEVEPVEASAVHSAEDSGAVQGEAMEEVEEVTELADMEQGTVKAVTELEWAAVMVTNRLEMDTE